MKRFAILLIILLVFSVSFIVSAQTVPDSGGGTNGCRLLTLEEAIAFLPGVGGPPSGAAVLAIYLCGGFGTFIIGDSVELFERDCEELNIYKVSSEGDQDLWQSDSLVCIGNQVAIIGGGQGHYVIYGYGSEAAEEGAPLIIIGAA
jgi:hypothetical protein